MAAPAIIKASSLGEALALSSLPVTSTVNVSAVPSQAAAYGLNTLAFYDDFNTGTIVNGTLTSGTTTIDLGETNTAGFNWYTKPASWPNGGDQTAGGGTGGWGFGPDPGLGITPSKINVSNSILSITGGGVSTACAAYTTSNPTGWHGWVVNGAVGWYCEMSFALPNGTWTLSDGAFPAWFNYSIQFYTGQLGTSSHWLEIDNWEQINGICGFNHDHLTVPGNDSYENNRYPTSSNGSPGPSTSQQGTGYNTHGTLYIPSTINGGTGFIARYWNNVQISTQYLSWTTGQNYDEGKNQHQLHFLNASHDDSPGQPVGPLNVDWVKVWAASSNGVVTS